MGREFEGGRDEEGGVLVDTPTPKNQATLFRGGERAKAYRRHWLCSHTSKDVVSGSGWGAAHSTALAMGSPA